MITATISHFCNYCLSWNSFCPEIPKYMPYGSKIHSLITNRTLPPPVYYKSGPALRARGTYKYWNKSILVFEDLSLAEKVDLQRIAITCECTLIKILKEFRGTEEGRMLSLAIGSHGKIL